MIPEQIRQVRRLDRFLLHPFDRLGRDRLQLGFFGHRPLSPNRPLRDPFGKTRLTKPDERARQVHLTRYDADHMSRLVSVVQPLHCPVAGIQHRLGSVSRIHQCRVDFQHHQAPGRNDLLLLAPVVAIPLRQPERLDMYNFGDSRPASWGSSEPRPGRQQPPGQEQQGTGRAFAWHCSCSIGKRGLRLSRTGH